MYLLKTFISKIRRFRRDETASIAVETVLMVPLMAWAMLATLTFFDAYRNEGISHKAGLTIADMISREADTIDDAYIDGAQDLLTFLSIDDPNPDLRISVYYWDANQAKYVNVWSEARGTKGALQNSDFSNMSNQLPAAADGERSILVETWIDYDPPWNVGIGSLTMSTQNVISPRFTQQLCFSNTPTNTATLKC